MTHVGLQTRHPRFVYQSYSSELTAEGLEVNFKFKIEPDIVFQPKVTIRGVNEEMWNQLSKSEQDSWVFNLGMAEIPSYWKSASSPEIVIEAGVLSDEQIAWWHDLLIKGMGEFFYVNDIDFTEPNFVKITSTKQPSAQPKTSSSSTSSSSTSTSNAKQAQYLIPVGGGKDSALTLCLFNQHQVNFGCFLLNPTQAALDVTQVAQPQQLITAKRLIDPKLLELNQKGYLNGHVPFSAYLAFLSSFTARIFNYQHIAISNECSSNEGNAEFHGVMVNHQYSKTFEFEQKFRQYVKSYLSFAPNSHSTPNYFSFLRPLYELQISKLFTQCPDFEQYASKFRSCNRGQKTNSWCGDCPKCLFTFTSLFPFLDEKRIFKIFGQNLFEKESLLDEALELLGVADKKPFECVGTHEESLVAFYLSIKKYQKVKQSLPILLDKINQQVISKEKNLEDRADKILNAWNDKHDLPDELISWLKKEAIIIFGLGREGWSSYQFLRQQRPEAQLTLADKNSFENLDPKWQESIKNNDLTNFIQVSLSSKLQTKYDLIFKTPGIPIEHPYVQTLIEQGSKLISNTKLFFQLATQLDPKPIIIGVTGTKGKSTTTAMIYHVLKKSGLPACLGGNIGVPPLELLENVTDAESQTSEQPIFVLELSSHQLRDLDMSPNIAVIQDIVPEHLDYYKNFEDYLEAKTNIVKFQTKKDLVIYNADSKSAKKLAQLSQASKKTFSLHDPILKNINTTLPGRHNLFNIAPSIIIGEQLGLSKEQVSQAIETFKPLPHRLELVAEIDGVKYYNDSLSTTPKATIAAIESFEGKPIILLAGGHERHQDFSQLARTILFENIKALALFPPHWTKTT